MLVVLIKNVEEFFVVDIYVRIVAIQFVLLAGVNVKQNVGTVYAESHATFLASCASKLNHFLAIFN